MEKSFWQSRWDSGRIGFHADAVNHSLVQHWPERVSGSGSVLVPLCGKSLDLHWLAERGHPVRGVEFVEQAVEQFFADAQLLPQVNTVGNAVSYQAGGIEILRGDFFRLTGEQCQPCDWVYDRAAMVAIAEQQRLLYVRKIHELTTPGAGILLLNFDHDMESGPPFSIPDDELRRVMTGLFSIDKVSERDLLEREPRFKDRGASRMIEQVWFGRRLS